MKKFSARAELNEARIMLLSGSGGVVSRIQERRTARRASETR